VPLTPELLDKAGRIWIPYKEKAKPSDEYYYLVSFEYIANGRVKLTRRVSQIVRKSDGKVLGERTTYSRSGGDLPGPWHSSRYLCPDLAKNPDFESLIFVKGDEQ
jgi:hypothetical protein